MGFINMSFICWTQWLFTVRANLRVKPIKLLVTFPLSPNNRSKVSAGESRQEKRELVGAGANDNSCCRTPEVMFPIIAASWFLEISCSLCGFNAFTCWSLRF